MNIDHFINVLFQATSIEIMKYIIKVLLSESIDFSAQYRYEHRSFHQCSILGYIYLSE